jgi:3-methyladenine DNA glycosylase AlkD
MNFAKPKADDVVRVLRALGTPKRAKTSATFFRIGPGEYGEGDRFLGVTVPVQRQVAKRFADLPLAQIDTLLRNPYHECRFTALIILVERFKRADAMGQDAIHRFYISRAKCINNWDLVDVSAPTIVGEYLRTHDRKILYRLARSKNIWKRRIAIVGTLGLITQDTFSDTLRLAELLLPDREDLIHKATGWMLREVGKRSRETLSRFLDAHASNMPRTALRYALEHYPQVVRKRYMTRKRL